MFSEVSQIWDIPNNTPPTAMSEAFGQKPSLVPPEKWCTTANPVPSPLILKISARVAGSAREGRPVQHSAQGGK